MNLSDKLDLVGRMLLCTRNHLIPPYSNIFTESKTLEMLQNYSSPASGTGPGTPVFRFQNENLVPIVEGVVPRKDQKIIYVDGTDRKSTRLNSSHRCISYAVFCLKKKTNRFIE